MFDQKVIWSLLKRWISLGLLPVWCGFTVHTVKSRHLQRAASDHDTMMSVTECLLVCVWVRCYVSVCTYTCVYVYVCVMFNVRSVCVCGCKYVVCVSIHAYFYFLQGTEVDLTFFYLLSGNVCGPHVQNQKIWLDLIIGMALVLLLLLFIVIALVLLL